MGPSAEYSLIRFSFGLSGAIFIASLVLIVNIIGIDRTKNFFLKLSPPIQILMYLLGFVIALAFWRVIYLALKLF
jgi:hypothetical protein